MIDKRINIGGLFSPWCITVVVWCAIGVLFAIFGDKLYPLTDQFYLSLLLWCGTIIPTSLFAYNAFPCRQVDAPEEFHFCKPICYALVALTLLLSVLHARDVMAEVTTHYSENVFKTMREYCVSGDYTRFPKYAYVLSSVSLLVCLWAYPKVSIWAVVCSTICALEEGIIIMEKGQILFVFFAYLFVLYQRKKIRIRTMGIVFAVIFVLMIAFNVVREGTEDLESDGLFDFLSMYIMSPSVAYCTVEQEITSQFGVNTFEVIYDYLSRFGLAHYEIHEKLQEFVYVPISTNVYTVMQPFYRDFGYAGVAVFGGIYGLFTGVLYRWHRNGNSFATALYTYVAMLLVLQFYQENIFLSLAFMVQLAVVLYVCTQNTIRWE